MLLLKFNRGGLQPSQLKIQPPSIGFSQNLYINNLYILRIIRENL